MDKIKFECFNCGAKVEASVEYSGRKGRCPKCGSKNTIPSMHETLEDTIITLFKDIDEDEEEKDEEKNKQNEE